MPSRKQRRRAAKDKRHEYEFVYVDPEGNELDEVPDELLQSQREKPSRNGSKASATKKPPTARGGRPVRVPPAPSWNRAVKRAGLLGAVVFVLFSFMNTSKKGSPYVSAAVMALIYTALFIPFTYAIDRFSYRRYQDKLGGAAPPAKKR